MGSSNDSYFINAYQSGKNRDLTELKAGRHLALLKCLLAGPIFLKVGDHENTCDARGKHCLKRAFEADDYAVAIPVDAAMMSLNTRLKPPADAFSSRR